MEVTRGVRGRIRGSVRLESEGCLVGRKNYGRQKRGKQVEVSRGIRGQKGKVLEGLGIGSVWGLEFWGSVN